ncbi:MAG TPA: M1 family aminopeptidase [Candidatus Baltobacteraceae bacterium]|nr:M1 family aminopeptidase [Candidatus Baltobacteraceae bacterium]
MNGIVALVFAAAFGLFGRGQVFFHPTIVAPYSFDKTTIRLHFNFSRGIVYGSETAILRAKHARLRVLPFNTLDIHYTSVLVNGQPVRYVFDLQQQRIDVDLPAPATAGKRLVVDFKYWAAPQRGIYFIRPDEAYPNITPEIWTQGEPTDNRRWFPTWDEPNAKTASELIVTVPRGWTVVANGYLKSHAHTVSTETWDWNSPRLKSTYLIAFAAGPLSKLHTSLGSLDVDAFVQPHDAALAPLCFGGTNQMIRYYQRIIGVTYPFEKYDQITAERFTFGGMENASATILTELALHPKSEDAEASCDLLVSHELAQHWFGDDVTMADWSNAWINEGFATYFDELWTGERFGEAAFEDARYRAAQGYFAETHQYIRPIVDYIYKDPLDLFDASGHERPAQALHMLRYLFGDARFFSALRTYLLKYQYKNANTDQFFATIGAALGTNLTWFKDEWFYRASYPHYFVSDSYDATKHALTLNIAQRDPDGRPFRMPIVIEIFWGRHVTSIRPDIDRNRQVLTIDGIGAKPSMTLFDPNNNILRELTFPKSVAELRYQLAYARYVGDREWALAQLTKRGDANSIARAAQSDAFYGVRADAVADAATLEDARAVEAGLRDRDVRVRLAAEGAAGALRGHPRSVIETLNAMTDDADPNVVAGAFAALGALHAPGVYGRLVAALDRPSFRQTVAAGALEGLAAYGDTAALPLIIAKTAYGTQDQERDAAVAALAELAKRTDKPKVALPTLLDLVAHDPVIDVRIAAANALGVLGDPTAIPALKRVAAGDAQLLVHIAAWDAMTAIDATRR